MAVFWVVAPCRLARVYRRFGSLYCLHHQADEMLENSYQSTRRYNPEDSHLHPIYDITHYYKLKTLLLYLLLTLYISTYYLMGIRPTASGSCTLRLDYISVVDMWKHSLIHYDCDTAVQATHRVSWYQLFYFRHQHTYMRYS
jgi:hypothetical protein